MSLIGGLAPSVFVPISIWFADTHGWRATLLILAVVLLTTCLPIHALALRTCRRSAEAAAKPADVRSASTAALSRALRHPIFWALLVTFTVHASLASAIVFHIIPLLQERGYSAGLITFAYSLIGPAQVGSRIGLIAAERYLSMTSAGILAVLVLPFALAMLIVLPPFDLTPCLVLGAYGIANGLVTIIRGTSVPDLLGAEGYGSINGAITLVARMGAAAAPLAVAMAWTAFGSYTPIVWILFGLAALGAASYGLAISMADKGASRSQGGHR
jgi:hypothetical protein